MSPTLTFPSRRKVARLAFWASVTGILFYLTAWMSTAFTLPGTWIGLVWPPNGVAVGLAILVSPWVIVGAIVADFVFQRDMTGDPVLAVWIVLANALQTLAITWAVRRFMGGRQVFSRPSGAVLYALVASVGLTTISASIAVTAMAARGSLPIPDYGSVWIVWWLGDVVAMLLIPPLLIVWSRRDGALGWRAWELALLSAATLAVGYGTATAGIGGLSLEFAVFALPLAGWAAFRFGDKLVVLVSLVLAVATLMQLGVDPPNAGREVASYFQAQTFIAAVSAAGLVVAAYVMRERLRYKAVAQKEFEAVDAARNRLLSSFAHELNNPLTPMRLQLDFLLAGYAGPLTEKQISSVAMIHRNTLRISKLVADLRDVSHLQSGQGLRMRTSAVDVAAVARDVTESYRLGATAAGVAIELDAPPSVLARGDPDRLVQVVNNLLGNAVKYTPRGGRVAVRVAQADGNAVLSIRDMGVGISPEQVEQLFRPFSQVQPKESQKEGTGLGLYIARGIVEAHGGRIWCASEGIGKGATFFVRIPEWGPPARRASAAGSGVGEGASS